MKKHTIPNEPEEMPIKPNRPEIKQPADPKQRELPQQEIPDIPQELPSPTAKPTEPKVI